MVRLAPLVCLLTMGCQRPAANPVEAEGLHNVHRVTDRLYSGSSPEGDAS